jgi:ATP-dependent Lon protease
MTGEITLTGRVLPIGGLKEKTMAAMRAGMRTVIIPEDNLPDLEEIDQTVRRALSFVSVSRLDAVIEAAFSMPLKPRKLPEKQEKAEKSEETPLAFADLGQQPQQPAILQ